MRVSGLLGHLLAALAAPGPAAPAAGPAMTMLMAVVSRIAATIRVIGAGYAALQVLIWHSFYAASPVLLWAPAVAAAWGAAAGWWLRRGRPRWPLLCLDSAASAGLALAAAAAVPPAMRGQPGSWLFISITTQLAAPAWLAPRRLSLPLTLIPVLGYAVAVTATPSPATPAPARPLASIVLLCGVVAVHWCGRTMLSRQAARADAGLAAASAEAREQYVILSRNLERREHDRLLHDTVLNTLTAVARTGPAGGVAGRCRQDLGLLQQALREPADLPSHGGLPWHDLLARLGEVAGGMRGRGLAVHFEPGEATAPVPVAVAEAITHATREALANVAAHAGTSEAWVTVGAGPTGLQVTIQDAGCGFDPGQVGPARFGVRRSIGERVADCGGTAVVRSAPGAGTVVSLHWPAAPAAPLAAAAAGPREPPC
jgi:signal transduction histidine kinase